LESDVIGVLTALCGSEIVVARSFWRHS